MEFSLEQLLISLAKKQLIIEGLEQQLIEITRRYNELVAQNDEMASLLPFPKEN